MFRGIQEKFHQHGTGEAAGSIMDEYVTGEMVCARWFYYMYEHLQEFQLIGGWFLWNKISKFCWNILVEIETEYTVKYMETAGIDPQGEESKVLLHSEFITYNE